MPTLPPVTKVVRVDNHFSFSTDNNMQWRNFFQYSGTLSVADAVTWGAAIVAAWNAHVATWTTTALTYTLMELTDLTSASSPQILNSTGGTGADVNPPVPNGVAMVMKHRFARRYRGGHSRVYLPGMAAAALLNPGTWSPTQLANVVAAYTAYVNAVIAGAPVGVGTVIQVNVSYFHGFTVEDRTPLRPIIVPTPRPTPLVDPITNIAGNPIVASQRRRNEQP